MSLQNPPLLLRPVGAAGIMTSRKEEALKYLRTIQAEYLTCALRQLIYTRENDLKYYKRVLEQKRERIERVGQREDQPTIFTEPALLAELSGKLHGPGGLPAFHYKDYSDKVKFEESDKRNYYQPGKRVVLQDGPGGRCAGLTPEGKVRVRLEGQSRKAATKTYACEQVTRVFEPAPEPAAPDACDKFITLWGHTTLAAK